MNPLRYGLMLACLPALSHAGANNDPSIGVYTHFEVQPAAPVVDAIKQELDLLLSPSGLNIVWRSLDVNHEGDTFPQVEVLTFKGACDVGPIVPPPFDKGPLGWTHVSDGEIIPFSVVDCDRLRGFLWGGLMRLWPNRRAEVFGRALARVVAHELYHALTHIAHHSFSGISQPAYNPAELLDEHFSFTPSEQRILSESSLSAFPHGRDAAIAAGRTLFARSGCATCHGLSGEGTSHGPSLRADAHAVEAGQLTARLKTKASDMYHQAHDSGVRWPSLAKLEIEQLSKYLGDGID